MAKKIALLLTLVMMFTISCVFATEADVDAAAPISEEVVSTEEVVDATEDIAEDLSGDHISADEPTTSGETVTTSSDIQEETHEEAGNGAVVGAIIAVVIVVAIVAIVWILNKK